MAVIRKDGDTCPICNEDGIIQYGGKQSSDFMVIVDVPSKSDWKEGNVLYGSKDNEPLYRELSKNKLDMYAMRLTSMYLHPKPSTKNKAQKEQWDKCKEYFLNKLIQEAANKKFILCLGSEVTKFFLGYGDVACSGIKLTSRLLSAPIVVGAQSLSYVKTQTHGEFALAIQKFAKYVKEYNERNYQ